MMAVHRGDRVRQRLCGVGTVIECAGDYVTVLFDSGPIRTFVATQISLESGAALVAASTTGCAPTPGPRHQTDRARTTPLTDASDDPSLECPGYGFGV